MHTYIPVIQPSMGASPTQPQNAPTASMPPRMTAYISVHDPVLKIVVLPIPLQIDIVQYYIYVRRWTFGKNVHELYVDVRHAL